MQCVVLLVVVVVVACDSRFSCLGFNVNSIFAFDGVVEISASNLGEVFDTIMIAIALVMMTTPGVVAVTMSLDGSLK